jgi:CheY-like chemotaxis protein
MHRNGQQPHILCINHSPEILGLLRDLLESEGFRVSTMTSLEHDLDAIVEVAPDLITIDYMWSTSDNEWTFLTMMTMDPRTRAIPVILCTGAVSQVMAMEQHLESIGVRVVLKPFDIEVFLQVVQDMLGQASAAEQDPVT